MPRYEPLPLPDARDVSNERLLEYLQQELRRLAGVLSELDQGRRDVLYVEPAKPRDGQLGYADGVTWNPGSGVGLYYRKSTDWVFAGNIGNLTNINISAGTTSQHLSKVTFSNANGVSFGLNGSVVTASVVAGGIPNFSAGTTSNNLGSVVFSNANGISFGLSDSTITATVVTNYLTTAALSNHSHGNPQLNLTNLSGTTASNSAGFTLSLAAGNYITTARASNDAVGLNTAATNVTWTVNSSGISLNAGAYLTTAMASNRGTDFVQATAAFAGTNASGTIASNGISVSVAAPGAGGGAALKGSGTYTQNTGTVEFANSNRVTFGLSNNGTMTASIDAAGTGTTFAGANISASMTLNSAGLNLSASVAAPGGGAAPTIYDWANMDPNVSVMNVSNMTAMSQQPFFFPMFIPGNLTWNRGYINVSRSTSGSNAFTLQFALYTFVNSTQISRLASLQNVFSNTATASVSGVRNLEFSGIETAGSSLTPGHYIGMLYFSAANTASMNYSVRGHSTVNPPVGIVGAGSNNVTTATSALSSIATRMFAGRYTTTTASPPATVGTAALRMFTTGWDPYLALGAR